jgi:hypothetical protein
MSSLVCPAGTFLTGVSYPTATNTNLRPRCRSFSHNGASLVASAETNVPAALALTYDCPGNGVVTRVITRAANVSSAPSQVAVECGQLSAFCDNDSWMTMVNWSGSVAVGPNAFQNSRFFSGQITNCRSVEDSQVDMVFSSILYPDEIWLLLDNISSGGFRDVVRNTSFSNPFGWSGYPYASFSNTGLWDWARGTWEMAVVDEVNNDGSTLTEMRLRLRCLNP